MLAEFSILISTKFKNQNLSKVNDRFFKNLGHSISGLFFAFHALGIIAFNIKRFSVCFFLYMSVCLEKTSNRYMCIPSSDTFGQIIQNHDWLGM